MAIYCDNLYNAITFEQDNLDNIMKKVQKASKRMFELSGGLSIDEYNERATKLEKVPAVYNFVLILSDVEAFTKKESYIKFAEKSPLSGTYFWVFGDKEKNEALIKLLGEFGILEIAKTGTIAIERGRSTIYDDNKLQEEFNYGKNVL